MFKFSSSLLKQFVGGIRNSLIYKIRLTYSKKFNNSFFFLASNLDFWLNNNNTRITFTNKNFDNYKEHIKEKKEKKENLSWFISSSLRSRAVSSYAKKGLSFSGHRIAKNYSIENITFNDSDKVVDCGANFGSLWIYLNNLGIPLTYIGIEPGESEFQGLSKSINFQNRTKISSYLIKKALGSKNGKADFFYSEEADSSIIPYKGYSKKYQIEITTLESLINNLGFQNKKIKLLKLEAEGAEPEVIMGAIKVLKNIEYIAADLGPERGLNKKCTIKEVTNLLLQNNFEIIDFKYPRICILFKNNLIS